MGYKVISFSLFGYDRKYLVGMQRNLELAKEIYPDWQVKIYFNDTVPLEFIESIDGKAQLIEVRSDYSIPGMMWRFYPNNDPDVERFIIRDADSRLSLREREAVDEWVESGRRLHVMRDHIHHGNNITTLPVMGGMIGLVCDINFNMGAEILTYARGNDLFKRLVDMYFLRDVIYPRYKNDMLIHSSIAENFEGETDIRPFPSPMKDYRFVGEIYDENDNRAEQYKLWVNQKEIR